MRALLLLCSLLVTQAFAAVPAINGTPVSSLGGSSNPTNLAAFSTSAAGKVLVACTINGTDISSITGASLTFAQRAEGVPGSNVIELWEADSAGAISSQTIVVNFTGAATFISCVVFGVGTEEDFDADASLPDVGITNADGEVSTDADDTMVINVSRGGTENPDPPATWTDILTNGFTYVYYKTFESPQTALAVPRPAGVTVSTWIADAVAGTAAGGSAVTTILQVNP